MRCALLASRHTGMESMSCTHTLEGGANWINKQIDRRAALLGVWLQKTDSLRTALLLAVAGMPVYPN